MNALDLTRPGVWAQLFPRALRLMTHLEGQTSHPMWSFGGGTVLMLRLGHRLSKDIDLFVPDPQYLGYVNPRLSDVAEEVSTDYFVVAGRTGFDERRHTVGTTPAHAVQHQAMQMNVEVGRRPKNAESA